MPFADGLFYNTTIKDQRMKLITFLLCIFFSLHLCAQNNTVSSGGQATGTGGSVSYSVGQIAYSSLSGTNGSLIQGVQQPYEISIITSINDLAIDLKAQVYPNPTTDQLILCIGSNEVKNLRYVLVDLQGKVLKSDRIINSNSSIDFTKLSNGSYFLRVLSNNKQVKTFQIIKNK
jgi:hypothetical protein